MWIKRRDMGNAKSFKKWTHEGPSRGEKKMST
jgi:hypothetical protein